MGYDWTGSNMVAGSLENVIVVAYGWVFEAENLRDMKCAVMILKSLVNFRTPVGLN